MNAPSPPSPPLPPTPPPTTPYLHLVFVSFFVSFVSFRPSVLLELVLLEKDVIATPFFVFNSKYDAWQLANELQTKWTTKAEQDAVLQYV